MKDLWGNEVIDMGSEIEEEEDEIPPMQWGTEDEEGRWQNE